MSKIDSLLNRFTMYKVVLYGLILLIFYAFLLTIPDLLPFNSIELGLSIAVIVNTCFITNFLFKKLFHAFTNSESWLITALILVLIVLPPSEFTLQELYPIFLISFLAIASKFLIAYRKKHLFNPVAISLVIMGMLGFGIGTWWVATPFMFIPTLIIGLFIVKKIRRFHMFLAFLIPASATMLLFGFIQGFSLLDIFNQSFLSWPIIFFGTIMLTEPLTTPPRKIEQIYYGAFVGFIFGTQYKIGPLYSTPELALVVGNIYSHTTQLKQKFFSHFSKNVKLQMRRMNLYLKHHKKFHF